MLGGEGTGGREGCCVCVHVGLKCRGRNENQLAGRHCLSTLDRESSDTERKARPSLIQSGLRLWCSSPNSAEANLKSNLAQKAPWVLNGDK